MHGLELQVATDAELVLRGHGATELGYITAQFEPFSSTQRPDLVFRPNSGPNQGRPFVVELRIPVDASRKLPTPENLQEHREFLEGESPNGLYFALATSLKLEEKVYSALSDHGINVFDCIESGEDLARRVLKWSGLLQLLVERRILKMVNQNSEYNQPARKSMTVPPETMPLFPDENVLGRAARNYAKKPLEENQAHISALQLQNYLESPLPDGEVFNEICGKYATGKNGKDFFGKLQRFFSERDMGSFQDNTEFMRFLKKTWDAHKCRSIDAHDLASWFREYIGKEEIGSKPRNKSRER